MKLTAIVLAMLFSLAATAQEKTDTIKVYGNCGMCKSRIEKNLKIDGVKSSTWDADAKTLIVTYDAAMISNEDIQKKMAAIGHDTDRFTAPDDVYKKLPGCCKYDRPAKKE